MATRYFRLQLADELPGTRAPLLERLLSRADEASVQPDWRAHAYQALEPAEPMPGIAAAFEWSTRVRAADGKPAAGEWLCLATPLHYTAEMSNVRLGRDGILALTAAESALLAEDFNRTLSDTDIHLQAQGPLLLCWRSRPMQAAQMDPERMRGWHIQEFLPTGEDAPLLKRLMSETELWLFQHALNRARAERGAHTISGLWLWGGGAALHSLPATGGGAAGEDVFFNAFRSQRPQRENVIVVQAVPGSECWRAAEARWLEPALVELRRGAISRLDISAGERCVHVGPRWHRRIFRKTRPWWEYFE